MLELKQISKKFYNSFYPALNNLSLHLNQGQFCTIIGCNGSGKSTLLKIISGEHKPDDGSITIDGQDLTTHSISKRAKYIASVVQDVKKGVVPEMNLLENMILSKIRTNGPKLKLASTSRNEIVDELKAFSLDYLIDKPLSDISGGQLQVVATIMAAISKPKILLLDEHTSALDTNMQKVLMQITAQVTKKYNTTIMMVTHRLDDALNYGDRLIMLDQGKIVLDVAGSDKKAFTIQGITKLFHQYEDRSLGAL